MGLFDAIIGGSATGTRPKQINVPPSRYQQAVQTYSPLPTMQGAAGNVISSQLAGQLTPAQLATLQDESARWGVQSGVPMSGAAQNRWDTSRVNATGALQQAGLQNFGNFQSGLEAGMNDPGLLSDIEQWNSIAASAPDPRMAAWADALNYGSTAMMGAFGIPAMTSSSRASSPTYSGFGRSPMQSALGGGYPSYPSYDMGMGGGWQDILGNDPGGELGIGVGGGGTGLEGFAGFL